MRFEFYRFRFHFRAIQSIYFPSGKSGNVVRGAFGTLFRKIACVPHCREAASCEMRAGCPYARIFEPRAARGQGPSGLADWPRPFVFRATHLDGRVVNPGESFSFDVNSFDVRDPALAYFVATFAQLAREGIGPQRGRAELLRLEQVNPDSSIAGELFARGRFLLQKSLPPAAIDLEAPPAPVTRVRVRFVTPTELKSGHEVARRPEFPILFTRVRDRLSTLRALYGGGPLEIDFRGMGERATRVRMTKCDLQWTEAERRSGRTGQVHTLGGFTGEAQYEGELGEFMPYLQTGKWTGVGRQTVWGKGEVDAHPDHL